MAVFNYTAVRAIAPGHIVGGAYSVTRGMRTQDSTNTTVKSQSKSLSGKTQTVVDRRETSWSMSTLQIAEGTTEYFEFREFVESVDEFESFSVDVDGGGFQPAIITQNYTRARVDQTNEFIFTLAFEISN